MSSVKKIQNYSNNGRDENPETIQKPSIWPSDGILIVNNLVLHMHDYNQNVLDGVNMYVCQGQKVRTR